MLTLDHICICLILKNLKITCYKLRCPSFAYIRPTLTLSIILDETICESDSLTGVLCIPVRNSAGELQPKYMCPAGKKYDSASKTCISKYDMYELSKSQNKYQLKYLYACELPS